MGQSPAGQGTGTRPRQEKVPSCTHCPLPLSSQPPGEGPARVTLGRARLTSHICVWGAWRSAWWRCPTRGIGLCAARCAARSQSPWGGGRVRLGAGSQAQDPRGGGLRGGAWWCSPRGDHPARGPRRDIVGDEGVVLYSLQDLKAMRGDVKYSPAQENPSTSGNPQTSLLSAWVPLLTATPRPWAGLSLRAPSPSS